MKDSSYTSKVGKNSSEVCISFREKLRHTLSYKFCHSLIDDDRAFGDDKFIKLKVNEEKK